MEMPRPGDAHRKLEALVGTWEGDETLFPSPWDSKGGKAKASFTAGLELDGFFVIGDYAEERDGKIMYRGHGVFGWDDRERSYIMYWFDSMGGGNVVPARGTWTGDTLTFQHQTAMGHTRYSYQFTDVDHYVMRLDQSKDGRSWQPFVEGKYKRR